MSHVKQIQQNLGELPALVLTDPISIRYASGFFITDGAAVIARDKAWFITDSRYVEAAEKAVGDMEVLCTSIGHGVNAILGELFAANGFDKAGAEENRVSHGDWTTLE